MTLHDELERIADRAPVADVPPETWRRARRARLRDLALVVGAATAVVALVAGVATWLPRHTEPPIANGDSLGVPDHLYAVPDRLSAQSEEDGWTSDAVEDDPTIGTAAAAWLTPSGLPVLVEAADGDYHLLEPPGYAGNSWSMHIASLHDPTIALSPDGERLAYSWAEFGPESANEPIPSGVRVVDLRTGELTTYPLPGAEGTVVESIVWSPDGRWLAWAGARMSSWTEMSMGGSLTVVGRIELSSQARQELISEANNQPSLGIDDDGVVAIGDDARLRFWDGHQTTRARFATTSERLLPAGLDGRWAIPGVRAVGVVDDDGVHDLPVARRTEPAGTGTYPVGWSGSDVVVLTDDGQGAGHVYLVPTDGDPARSVGVIETRSTESVTLAVDLITAAQSTVTRPEPEWPWSTDRKVAVFGGGAAALALLLLTGRLIRRRRRFGTSDR